MTAHRKLTQQQLATEARERFGDDQMSWAFQCPSCKDVATLADFRAAEVDPGRAGQECLGRHMTGRGCDWAAYGLFRGPWEIVVPAEGDRPERSIWGFPLAPVGGVA
jgi:hypothetical protein